MLSPTDKDSGMIAVDEPMQQYIKLLSGSDPASADASYIRTIVLKALTDPKVYAGFHELQSLPVVQKTLGETPTGKSLLDTLSLFAFGVYRDYRNAESSNGGSSGQYVQLTDAQLVKLKALTVISTIHNHCKPQPQHSVQDMDGYTNTLPTNSRRNRRRNKVQAATNNTAVATTSVTKCGMIPYATLQEQLGLDGSGPESDAENVRQLEELLIHCIYANLLPPGTKLNQQNRSLDISLSSSSTSNANSVNTGTILCRDVHLEKDLPEMIAELEDFYQHGLEFKKGLQDSIQKWKEDAWNESRSWSEVEAEMKSVDEKLGADMGMGMGMGMHVGGGGLGSMISSTVQEAMNWSNTSMDGSATRQVKRSRAASGALHGAKKGFLKFGNK